MHGKPPYATFARASQRRSAPRPTSGCVRAGVFARADTKNNNKRVYPKVGSCRCQRPAYRPAAAAGGARAAAARRRSSTCSSAPPLPPPPAARAQARGAALQVRLHPDGHRHRRAGPPKLQQPVLPAPQPGQRQPPGARPARPAQAPGTPKRRARPGAGHAQAQGTPRRRARPGAGHTQAQGTPERRASPGGGHAQAGGSHPAAAASCPERGGVLGRPPGP